MQRAALKLPPFFRFAACSMQHAKHFQLYLVHFMAVDGAAVEFILLPNSKCKNRAHKKQHQQQVKDTDKVAEGEKGGIDRGAGIYALCCCCQDTEMRQATKTQQMRQTFHFWVCASAPLPLLLLQSGNFIWWAGRKPETRGAQVRRHMCASVCVCPGQCVRARVFVASVSISRAINGARQVFCCCCCCWLRLPTAKRATCNILWQQNEHLSMK